MITRTIAGLVLLAAVASEGALRAEAARATFPDERLEALVSEALLKNPDVAAALATSEAAGFRVAPARTLPDPFLSFNYQNDGTAISLGERDMTFLGGMFSQTLPWPGKLRLAGDEARQRAEEVRAGTVGRTRLAVEARVRRAYYEYLLAQALLDLIEDRSRSWREISAIVRERYAVGFGVQQDVLRSQVEVLRLDEARVDQAAQVANRRTELNRMIGRPQGSAIETAQRLDFRPEVPDLESLLQAARDRSPELAALERGIEAGRIRVSLARKDFLPDFNVSAGPMYRGGLDPMWQVGLGITLPIYAGSRQRPRLNAAGADLRSDEARVSSVELELEFRTRERYETLNAALKVAKLYREGVLPVDQLSLESAVASYRTGKVPFVTVLEALNTLYADRAIYLTRLAEAERWRVSIDEADLQPAGGMSAGAAPSGPSPGA
ncbi:MAG: TolC family protein, partial [Acidobacteriota bacterium]|nr:TolC family protein [Acidobacteriota bacterium]